VVGHRHAHSIDRSPADNWASRAGSGVASREYQPTEVEYRAREDASEGISIDRLLASAL
jgi:hypothetical protein